MKKHSLKCCRYKLSAAVLCGLSLMLISGCVSRAGSDGAPLLFSLMPADTALYIQFPVKANEAAVITLVSSAAPELPLSTVRKIVKRIDTVYAGFDSSGKMSAVLRGSFPSFALGAVFSKKNGWSKVSGKDIPGPGYYYVRSDIPLQFAFPSSALSYVSPDVAAMFAKNSVPDDTVTAVYGSYGFSKAAPADICFYVKDVSSFIRKLQPDGFNFPAQAVSGTLSAAGIDPETGVPLYSMDALIEFSDSRALRPALAVLKIAARVSGKTMLLETAGTDSIRISGAVFDINTLISFFGS